MGAFGALDPSSNLGRAIIINKQSNITSSYHVCRTTIYHTGKVLSFLSGVFPSGVGNHQLINKNILAVLFQVH